MACFWDIFQKITVDSRYQIRGTVPRSVLQIFALLYVAKHNSIHHAYEWFVRTKTIVHVTGGILAKLLRNAEIFALFTACETICLQINFVGLFGTANINDLNPTRLFLSPFLIFSVLSKTLRKHQT